MAVSAALLPILAIGATVAGTALSVAGTIATTSANVNAANYQAMIADRNSQIQQQNAARAEARAQQEQQDSDRKSSALIGEITAHQSASGLSLGGRSSMLTRKSARELARIDALNVRQAGDLEAYNYKVASEDSTAAAGFARSQASSSVMEGWLNAGSSIVGGAGKVFNSMSFMSVPATGSAYRAGGWGSGALAR